MTELPQFMNASVLTGPRSIALESRPLPTLDKDQVLVEVASVGVCGSDVHFWHDGRLGDWVVRSPLVLGHEAGGQIVAVGLDVSPRRLGQRVSIEPQRPELTSRETLDGKYNLDPQMQFYATPGVDGAFAQYVAIQSHFAWSVPDSISDDSAALMEPLSVAVATARKGGFTVGSRVLITGAGPIGIMTAQVARAFGASEVIVSDVSEERRRRSLGFGATSTIDPLENDLRSSGVDVDVFVDASGASAAVQDGIHCVRPGGVAVLVGMGSSEMSLPVARIQSRELRVTGVFRYANTWPTSIHLVRSGKVDLDSIVTGHFGLEEVDAALSTANAPGNLKSVVHPQVKTTVFA